MEKFIKDFKYDLIFYGSDYYKDVGVEKETHDISDEILWRYEELIWDNRTDRCIYRCMEVREDGMYEATSYVSILNRENLLKTPVREIEKILNEIYFYGLTKIEGWEDEE